MASDFDGGFPAKLSSGELSGPVLLYINAVSSL